MIYLGVDVGKTGAVAVLTDDGEAWGEIIDTGDGHAVDSLLRAVLVEGERVHAGIERVHAYPKQGIASTFKFGKSAGVVEGVICSLQIPWCYITPQRWTKRALRGRPHSKDKNTRKAEVLQAARERWPGASLKRKKDGAVAEALWMALVVKEEEA